MADFPRDFIAIAEERDRLRQELSLAEEGLANYEQENGQFKKALEMIRDRQIPQAMSPALFAEFVLKGPAPHPSGDGPEKDVSMA